jgi:ABC-type Fe3+/spermidine/putrescine transport system ATPase subunit
VSTAFFSLQNASAGAGSFQLGPLALDLAEKDWFVLLGPSGSGKTTLLGLIAGVRTAPPGTVLLGGRDIGPLPPEQRRVAYVSQTGDLFPHLTVAGNVAFGLRFSKYTKQEQAGRVERLLALFGLEALAGQSAATVSGGEGRRVALARALAVEPALLLLDEPLGMLDPPGRRAMQDCLARVHRELGTTTLHVTHDLREAKALGSRAGILMGGKLIQEDTVERLFQHPATPETARFLSLEAV